MSLGHLAEVFSSIQGEGLYVGERHIFVRLGGCNQRCSYCDTAWAREPTLYCRAERAPGAREFDYHPNPLSPQQAGDLIARLHSPPPLHDAVSLTGGEPLLQAEFTRDLARAVRALGLKAHLETNGTLAHAVQIVGPEVDVIAMDVKLPSAAGFECWPEHQAFLDAARGGIGRGADSLFAKAVFAQGTTEAEIEQACRLLAAAGGVPLVLQPVWEVAGGPQAPLPERALELHAAAKRFLPVVRVIPQAHKLMGQM